MASSSIDLLFLTFNCAKNLIDVPLFANHLHTALAQNATLLPDLVVFSLQEIAPLSYAFIGGYFLNDYITRFDDALNLAANKFIDQDARPDIQHSAPIKPHYSLIRARNVGYTAILLFSKDSKYIHDVQEAEVGFGAAEMGNKGAVGLRVSYGGEHKSTQLTFVATHLAAMEWNLPKRNANWAAIMRGMTFRDPAKIIDALQHGHPQISTNNGAETSPLLPDTIDDEETDLQRELHEISIFSPSSHLFVGGDLNYRISTTSPTPNSAFPNMDPASPHYYPSFFKLDQLTRERLAGRTFHGMTEHKVKFPPTYKYMIEANDSKSAEPVPWKFAPHRYPSWTDRILYMDIPNWIQGAAGSSHMEVRAYDALPVIRTSDHRPVFLRIGVPILNSLDFAIPPTADMTDLAADPRLRLPVEIDPEAWQHRAAARRREVMLGWSMFLWSTKEGMLVFGTIIVTAISSYWLYQTR